MDLILFLAIVAFSYLAGSIPFGYLIIRWRKGLDIRDIQSGRTGGTNAMRAGGFRIGLTTAALDMLKGAATVWVAQAVFPGNAWVHIAAPVLGVLGHNYSIFMLRRNGERRLRFSGGAGGAPCVGGSIGLWAPSVLIIVPVASGIFYGIGYASITTLSVGLISSLVFTYRAFFGLSPWAYAVYGLICEIILIWALVPNIRRLRDGSERLHGWRAKQVKAQSTGSDGYSPP